MKVKDLKEREKCITKGLYQAFSSPKEKNYYNSIIIKKLFEQNGLNFDTNDILTLVKDNLPVTMFSTVRENLINSKLLILRLLRLKNYFENKVLNSTTIVHKGSQVMIPRFGIELDYNFIIENGNEVTIYKVKNKKADISLAGQSVHTKASENIELYLMQEVAEQKFPGKKCSSCIVFLRHPDDKDMDNYAVSYASYENKKTFVKQHFTIPNKSIDERIESILAGKPKYEKKDCADCSYKCICDMNNCNMQLFSAPKQSKSGSSISFDSDQMKVIDADDGIFRVIAGAGAGKTTCIAKRICRFIEEGNHPNKILLITFTEKGATEMREKIDYWLKKSRIKKYSGEDFNIHTFNSFGFEIVKKEYKSLGFSDIPKLLDKSEKISLIKSILDNEPELEGYNYKDPLLNIPYGKSIASKGVIIMMDIYFNIIKAKSIIYPDEFMAATDILDDDIAEKILSLYHKYTDYMKQNNLVDYEDQLSLCYELLSDTNKLKYYGFEHIIVDEFQDSNNIQIQILNLLMQFPYFHSLMVVGDDSQAIYGWRGATAYNIINFNNIFENVKDIFLTMNYRSTQEICNLANHINEINIEKIEKRLTSTRYGDRPKLNNSFNMITDIQNDILKNNRKFSDIAIITRTNSELKNIQEELAKLKIPSIISVSELLIDNVIIKNLINFSRFLLDNENTLGFVSYLKVFYTDDLNKQTSNTINTFVKDSMDIFLTTLSNYTTDEDKVNFILTELSKLNSRAVDTLLNILRSKNFKDIESLSKFMIEMELFNADYSIEKYDTPINAITLTTAHSSKGREWDSVYLNVDKFSYPKNKIDYQTQKNLPEFEEERRLLFVAITRAKNNLSIYSKSSNTIYDEIRDCL